MLIEYEGVCIFLGRLLDEPDNIGERVIFNDNGREAVEYKQEFLNDRGEEELDINFIIYMVKENVQQGNVSGVQLRKNCKEEVEKVRKMKSVKKRDNKKEKLTKEICINKERGQQKNKIWSLGRTEVTVVEELNPQHDESDDLLESKVWDTGRPTQETHDQEVMKAFNFGSLMQENSGLVSNVMA